MNEAISSVQNDSLSCVSVMSKPPNITLHEACWLGIDEAGRGPVLG